MKSAKTLKSKRNSNFREQLPMIMLAVPFCTFFIVFTVIPILSSMVLSFTSYDMLSLPKFIGVNNYMRMFVQDDVFGVVVKNTIALAVVVGPAGFMLAFLLAWLVNEFST
jgi:multiple sugar transport system permease protein